MRSLKWLMLIQLLFLFGCKSFEISDFVGYLRTLWSDQQKDLEGANKVIITENVYDPVTIEEEHRLKRAERRLEIKKQARKQAEEHRLKRAEERRLKKAEERIEMKKRAEKRRLKRAERRYWR